MIGVGIVGFGYWGPNIVRNLYEHPEVRVVSICDSVEERLALAARRYPGVSTCTSYEDMLANPAVDAVAICTPVASHFPLALQALQSGRHVLVEKPLASTVEEATRLVDEAARRNLHLGVDHTFVFHPAIRRIKELVKDGSLGERVLYYDSVRVNLGLFQHDVNVLWDLAVHDLAIMDFVLPGRPLAVSATGVAHVPDQLENMAYLTCFYPDNLLAHIHVNWLAPVKVRQTLIGGDQKMIVYNELEPSEKLKVYDKGVTFTLNGNGEDSGEMRKQYLVDYRAGDMWAPKIPATEALRTGVDEFVKTLQGKMKSLSDGEAGLRIVQTLAAATHSMKHRGIPVELTLAGVTA